MDKIEVPLSSFSRDQRKLEELTQQLRHLQLNSESTISGLQMQLKAEKEKSLSLENALRGKDDSHQLIAKLREAEEIEKKLRTDLVKLTRHSMIVSDDDSFRSRAQELETENFLLTQKVKGLERQIRDVKAQAVTVYAAEGGKGKRTGAGGGAGTVGSRYGGKR